MLPKLLLAPMRTYLRMLAKTFRPSTTPSSSTSRDFSSRIMSADSLAISTAVSTLMPDVGRVQGRGVVDAVAHEAHGVLAGLQGLDDALLVGGRDAGEQRGLLRRVRQLRVGHLLDLAAEQHELGGQPDFLADLAGDQVVVARDDLDGDAVALQGLDRGRGRVLGRVEEGRHSRSGSGRTRRPWSRAWRRPRRYRAAQCPCWRSRARGSHRPQSCSYSSLSSVDVSVVHRVELAVELEVRAAREDRLRGSLADDAVLAFGRADHDRHDAALEVEGDLVDLGVFGDRRRDCGSRCARAPRGPGRSSGRSGSGC